MRNGPRIYPTEQALRLHEYVETALTSLQQIRLRANEIWKEEKTPLLIAATPAMSSGLPLSGVVLRELDVEIPYYFGVTTPQSKPPP